MNAPRPADTAETTSPVSQRAQSFLLALSERLLRSYWHLARHWI